MMELTWYVGSNRILNLTVRMFIYLHVCVGVCTHLRVYMCRMRAHAFSMCMYILIIHQSHFFTTDPIPIVEIHLRTEMANTDTLPHLHFS